MFFFFRKTFASVDLGRIQKLAVVYFTTILTHVVLADKYYLKKLAVFA